MSPLLAFAPMHNTGTKHDASGAFQPEARAFLRYHGAPASALVLIDNSRSPVAMRAQVFAAISAAGPLAGIAFFCHGFRAGIQFGIRTPEIGALVDAIPEHAPTDLRVTFYACDAARDADRDRDDDRADLFGGDGGFADRVRDQLWAAGLSRCVVDAHTTAAHTTRNPDVRRFEGALEGGKGGRYIVPRDHALWRAWRVALRGDLRFAFPFLTVPEIHDRLRDLLLPATPGG